MKTQLRYYLNANKYDRLFKFFVTSNTSSVALNENQTDILDFRNKLEQLIEKFFATVIPRTTLKPHACRAFSLEKTLLISQTIKACCVTCTLHSSYTAFIVRFFSVLSGAVLIFRKMHVSHELIFAEADDRMC